MTADSFGMPITVFADHPDRFYGGVGRLVCFIATSLARIESARPSRTPRLLMAAQQLLPTLDRSRSLKWAQNGRITENGVHESLTAATHFARGAGDGNRTRTVSLGIRYGPAHRVQVTTSDVLANDPS